MVSLALWHDEAVSAPSAIACNTVTIVVGLPRSGVVRPSHFGFNTLISLLQPQAAEGPRQEWQMVSLAAWCVLGCCFQPLVSQFSGMCIF